MSTVGLPARIAYAAVALPIGGAAGFYSSVFLLPRLTATYPQLAGDIDWHGMFNMALGVGAMVAFTASLLALTLPWKRHRKRHGRAWRIGISCVLVVVASVGLAGEGYSLIYNLAFAAWLAYTIAFTYVRYGVLDEARWKSSSGSSY